jgi:DNA-binding transcriptional regulator YdaS (Cro superfamily)
MIEVKDIFEFFETKKNLLNLLGCKAPALSRWERCGVPPRRAIEIEVLSKGEIKAVDIPLYKSDKKSKGKTENK